ncbi:class D beta-lactamase [Ferruginibacter sp. HRS2-29]|uniref:class D beta-lactamase n=1 Tax=Ferruginibacter sp. HRS2-29 TaxID=2487334 RepID=UPI0020CC2E30|nr:class D beta-lactamase [Ferruginibacter sp. HRS2-29]MCP9752565.1 class D beta-lactamase [Ferruginibacter sp. HRS2-29]
MKRTNTSLFLFLTSLFLVSISSCSVNKAKIDNNLKKYFDSRNVEGCFTMLNNTDGQITVYNMELDTTRFLPASTYKIVNSLIGLQTGVITSPKMVIKWDGVKRWNDDWNQDMDMTKAFKLSNVAYYQEVARRIGHDTMQSFIDSLSYGNKNISGAVDSFWLNNKLKISPDEQLGLLKRLYFDQLPFRKSVQQEVREVMVQEDNTAYKLSYKTGWGWDESNNAIGWLVGWVEENKHVYFFVTLVKSKDKDFDMKPARIGITKDILKELGFLQGKM